MELFHSFYGTGGSPLYIHNTSSLSIPPLLDSPLIIRAIFFILFYQLMDISLLHVVL